MANFNPSVVSNFGANWQWFRCSLVTLFSAVEGTWVYGYFRAKLPY